MDTFTGNFLHIQESSDRRAGDSPTSLAWGVWRMPGMPGLLAFSVFRDRLLISITACSVFD